MKLLRVIFGGVPAVVLAAAFAVAVSAEAGASVAACPFDSYTNPSAIQRCWVAVRSDERPSVAVGAGPAVALAAEASAAEAPVVEVAGAKDINVGFTWLHFFSLAGLLGAFGFWNWRENEKTREEARRENEKTREANRADNAETREANRADNAETRRFVESRIGSFEQRVEIRMGNFEQILIMHVTGHTHTPGNGGHTPLAGGGSDVGGGV